MTIKFAYRAQETSVSQGTGTINLDGAVAGFQTLVAGVGSGSIVNYTIQEGAHIESGIGTVTAGSPDTLSRDTIIYSTNSNNAINWGAGTRNVFLSVSPELQVWRDENLNDVSAVGVGGGTASAHTVTMTPAPFDYSDNMLIKWTAPAQNGAGGVTVNVNNLGDKAYVNADLAAFPPGMIKAGSMQEAVYDAANNRFIRTTQAFDPANYATAAQGAKADTALQPDGDGSHLTGVSEDVESYVRGLRQQVIFDATVNNNIPGTGTRPAGSGNWDITASSPHGLKAGQCVSIQVASDFEALIVTEVVSATQFKAVGGVFGAYSGALTLIFVDIIKARGIDSVTSDEFGSFYVNFSEAQPDLNYGVVGAASNAADICLLAPHNAQKIVTPARGVMYQRVAAFRHTGGFLNASYNFVEIVRL